MKNNLGIWGWRNDEISILGGQCIVTEMWAYSSGGGSQIDLETKNNTKMRTKVKGMDVIMKKLPEVRRKHSKENPENYMKVKSSFISLLFSVASPLKRRKRG